MVIFLGDYREEVILGSSDYKSIYILTNNPHYTPSATLDDRP